MSRVNAASSGETIGAGLDEGLARESRLLGVGWLDCATARAVWRHRGAVDTVVETEAMTQARRLATATAAAAGVQTVALPASRSLLLTPMPFAPGEMIAAVTGAAPGEAVGRALVLTANDVLRRRIGALLAAGLPDRKDEFPETDHDFTKLIRLLRTLPDNDLVGRLALGGFADHPIGEGPERMRCQECIYFLPNRRWCDLPELPMPVEPDWYCRLWKM